MRFYHFFILLFVVNLGFSQESNLEQSIAELKQKIQTSGKGEKLKLLDSLYQLTYEKRQFKYDSILKVYIDYAFEIDSIDLAVRRTSDLVFYYANRIGNPKEAAKVFDEFESKNIKVKDTRLLSQLYRNGGDSYYFSGKTTASETLYGKAETYAIKGGDSIAYALARAYKSAVFSSAGDYVTASKLLTETAQIFQREKDTANLLFARNELATLYTKIGFLEDSKKERDEIIAIGQHMHNNESLVSISHQSLVSNLYNAALEQNIAGNQTQRIAYLTEAYKHVTEPNYKLGIDPIIFYGLLSAYSESDSLTKATAFYNKIQSAYAKEKPIPFENHYRTGLTNYYIATKEYNKALKEAKWVLEYHKRGGNTWGVYHMDERLSRIYKALGNTDASYKHYVDFVTLRDSINSVKKGQALSYYQTLYETEKRDFKIAEQQSEITVLQTEASTRFWKITSIFIGVFGFVFIGVTIILRKRREQIRLSILQNEILQKEIKFKQKDISDFALNISRNRKWRAELLSYIKKIKKLGTVKDDSNFIALEKSIVSRDVIDKRAVDIKNKVDIINNAFYEKLKEEYPNLTKSEIKLCSFIRLSIDNKEIATLQNVALESVYRSRTRLRKKLNLSPEDDLNTFFHKL